MRVLVACEFSGVVRDAFAALGHDAWSCDIEPSEKPGNHLQMDVRHALTGNMKFTPMGSVVIPWDLMIAHPPCTHLSVSGARWFKDKLPEQKNALDFVETLMKAPIPHICIENPVSIISTKIRKPDQIIQPFHFGDPYRKTTCLWLKGLPKLKHTSDMKTGEQACWKMPPSPNRAKERSRIYPGIASAMAIQWNQVN